MVFVGFRLARRDRATARFRPDARPELVRLLLRRRPVQRRFEPGRDRRRLAQLGRESLRPLLEGLDPLREDEEVARECERLHVDLRLVQLVGPLARFRLSALAAGQAGQLWNRFPSSGLRYGGDRCLDRVQRELTLRSHCIITQHGPEENK